MTPKQIENFRKIAAAQADEIYLHGNRWFSGFSGREIAGILWPDSPGWNKRSRRHSTPAGGAMGATMPMLGARRARELHDEGMIAVEYTDHHQARFRISYQGQRWLERNPG